ncbi:FAD-binding oxidoreductase [Nitratireductor sp. OM-1]|uniref:NAD(P)/FAD-dependent oxidoreductase n=1 Tax=Nitratireductor sp. OM-1 TaxID=1756988 RepID=UPI000DDC68B9|nr:FAD-dependent oxidoreductase [Nitratireductor sp. OM-1]
MKFRASPPLKPSHWQTSVPAATSCHALQGNHHADVAIVGGGFVGLWTALTIRELEPDCRVAIIEQHLCGSGASGRNGGFAMSWWPKIGTLRALCGDHEARFLGQQSEKAILDLGEFCARHGIDAHFTQKGWLWTATSPAHIDTWDGTLAACAALGAEPFQRLSGEEVRRRTGSPTHLAGVFEASNATVQPYALVQGIRRVALDTGVTIFENSHIHRIEPGAPVRLITDGGTLDADRVVLATNVWSASIPELARLIVPVNSSIVITQPLGDRLEKIGWTGGESITDSQLMVDYYRTTRDGRIAFGKGTGAMSFGDAIGKVFSEDAATAAQTRDDLFVTFPMLSRTCLDSAWSGPIDRTFDSVPVFGHLRGQPNICYGIGWSGNGVGPSRLGGYILASMALRRDDEWSRSSLIGRRAKTFPPEPFRYVGGSIVRNAVRRTEIAEMQGRRPRSLDNLLAGLAPAGLEDKN